MKLESNDFSCKRAKFDFLKYKVKERAISEAKIRAKLRRKDIEILENSVLRLENQLNFDPNSNQAKIDLENAQERLDSLYEEKAKALIIQSKISFYEEGGKNTKFFLNLVKRKQEKSCIRKLKIDDNTTTPDDKII